MIERVEADLKFGHYKMGALLSGRGGEKPHPERRRVRHPAEGRASAAPTCREIARSGTWNVIQFAG